MNVTPRLATLDEVPRLDALIAASARGLAHGFYDEAQVEALTRLVFGVDSQLVRDGSYYVIEEDGRPVACGGWSRRGTLFGSDDAKRAHGATGDEPDPLLDPAVDAARIRAFFVAPDQARRGLGSLLMRTCARAAWDAGFRRLTLVATMPGVPLYTAFGFVVEERFDIDLGTVKAPLATMSRALDGPAL